MNLTIGSGDISNLLAGKQTKAYASLWQKFVANDKPYYNAFNSPIDALRIGAILERQYLAFLTPEYYTQVKVTPEDMPVLTVSLDFAKVEFGKVSEFRELKTIWFTDFIEVISRCEDHDDIKKNFKDNYNQVQAQLLATGLDYAYIDFLAVYSYDDEVNKVRVIEDKDVRSFKIERDPAVIEKILSELEVFNSVMLHTFK